MNSTMALLLSSLMMGTTFLQKISLNTKENKTISDQTEARTYLSNHPLLGGGGRRDNRHENDQTCWQTSPHHHGDEQHKLVDGYPFGRPIGGSGVTRSGVYPGVVPPGRGEGYPRDVEDNCRVRIGLRYSSCFSKFDDFDDKFDELRHHVQSLPRGADGHGNSPCSTLKLLAKVKSTPLYDRCVGNQYLLRTPYHMYNIKGELRYIVQDAPHLEQCYLEAACDIPTRLCGSYGYPQYPDHGDDNRGGGGGRRRNAARSCESRQCHHTLLAWDPTSPDAGTFFDTFEYSCCCNCHVMLPNTNIRSQVVG